MLQTLGQRLGHEERAVTYNSGLELVDAVDCQVEAADTYLRERITQHLAWSSTSRIGQRKWNRFHMEMDITGAPLDKLRTGDHLPVWPLNPDGEVERLKRVCGWDEKIFRSVIDIKGWEQASGVEGL